MWDARRHLLSAKLERRGMRQSMLSAAEVQGRIVDNLDGSCPGVSPDHDLSLDDVLLGW